MEICSEKVTVVTAGGNGVAVGSAVTKALSGFLLDITLDYGTVPATTDLTVTDELGNQLLAVANSATDTFVAPRQKMVDNANAAIANSHDRFPLAGRLTFALAESNAANPALTATVRYLRI